MSKPNYLSAYYDRRNEKILVWEKVGNERRRVDYPCPYYFYVPSVTGEHTSIFGDKLRRIDCEDKADFEMERRKFQKKFESDFSALSRVLLDTYSKREAPSLTRLLFDIENDYDKLIGYASVEDPYAPINAISICYQVPGSPDHFGIGLVPPPGVDLSNLDELIEKHKDPEVRKLLRMGEFKIFENERQLLQWFFTYLEHADIISGWNSEFFDVPYMVKRTELVFGKQMLRKWSLDGAPDPYFYQQEHFGREQWTCDTYGRVHLDYLRLFKKFTFEGRSSFSLEAIANDELDIPKLDYEGSLYDLYRNDPLRFAAYCLRDSEVIQKLDYKFKFVDLANVMVHDATVLFHDIFGTVNLIDTAFINFAHHELNLIVMDKEEHAEEHVEGAIVMTPKVGLHENLGSIDINSLYPSIYRALNLSPEMVIGQFTNKEDDWKGIIARDDQIHTLIMQETDDEGKALYAELTGSEWFEAIKENLWALSAYGTVLDQSRGKGLIPQVLESWYVDRKKMQAKKKEYSQQIKELKTKGVKSSNSIEEKKLIESGTLFEDYGFIYDQETWNKLTEAKRLEAYYDLIQLVKKILLNSAYGATLSRYMRFSNTLLGASTTGTGRAISQFMGETVVEYLSGEKTLTVKTVTIDKDGKRSADYWNDSPFLVYGDTDSCRSDTVISTDCGEYTIQYLFENANHVRYSSTNTEHAFFENEMNILTYVPFLNQAQHLPISEIYRHKVTKRQFMIEDEFGNQIFVTEDHSCMVERNKILLEVKPTEIIATDLLISVYKPNVFVLKSYVQEVKEIESFKDEYVYDIVMKDSNIPYFFGNNILVHNSCYFNMSTLTSSIPEAVALADSVADHVNIEFEKYMKSAFFCQPGFDNLIKCGREVVADRGIFLAKKKYMLHVVDLDGFPVDKIKAMGAEMAKKDTPKPIRAALTEIVEAILRDGKSEDEVHNLVLGLRKQIFREQKNLASLAPVKSVNNYEKYEAEWIRLEKSGLGKVTLPQTVRASINYNNLVEKFQAKDLEKVRSGDKIKIFYLLKNIFGFDSIAFQSDFDRMPWIIQEAELQIDVKRMQKAAYDEKLNSLFQAIGWSEPTDHMAKVKKLLEF